MSFSLQFGGPKTGSVWPRILPVLILVLLCGFGCTRPAGIPGDPSAVQNEHEAPFQPTATDAPNADPVPSFRASSNHSPDSNLPFDESPSLPAGTLLTVRLTKPVYAEHSISSAAFEAVVVDPVVVEGNTLIPRGANVAGLVESVRASQVKPTRGYVRMALQSVQLGDSELEVRTASLFAPQAPPQRDSSSLIRLEKGRQLTFRVTEPVYTSNQHAKTAH